MEYFKRVVLDASKPVIKKPLNDVLGIGEPSDIFGKSLKNAIRFNRTINEFLDFRTTNFKHIYSRHSL